MELQSGSNEALYKNVEVMYYAGNGPFSDNYAVKLKTKEDEEIIFYRTDKIANFDELYDDIVNLESEYEGEKEFCEYDTLMLPNINLDLNINYEELCGKNITNLNGEYIENAMQNIQFSLDQKGGTLKSQAVIQTNTLSGPSMRERMFDFCMPACYMFIKENDKERPYFAMKVNIDFLEEIN